MRRNTTLDAKLDEAQLERRCAFSQTETENRALNRRAARGVLIRPYADLFLRADYAATLTRAEITLHVARALQLKHRHWVFTGWTGALIWGFEHPWHMHRGVIFTISRTRTPAANSRHLSCVQSGDFDVHVVDGLRVTSPARTIIECARQAEAREARAPLDSALRSRAVAKTEIRRELTRTPYLDEWVLPMLAVADPRCENGGESYTHHTICELGFEPPRMQREFVSPRTGAIIRPDCLWIGKDGVRIFGELDGESKYCDPRMTDGRSISEIVQAERERQHALEELNGRVVRWTFPEVRDRVPLRIKLERAQVPMLRA